MSRVARLLAVVFGLARVPAGAHDVEPVEIEGEYRRITRTIDLPPEILDLFDRDSICPGLAECGGKFTAGCIIERGVPCARMLAAGRRGDVGFLHFERGGSSHTDTLFVFRLAGSHLLTWVFLRPGHHSQIDELEAQLPPGDPCRGDSIESRGLGLCLPPSRGDREE